LQGHGEEVLCVAFSPDGRSLASASGLPVEIAAIPKQKGPVSSGEDLTIRLWDLTTGRQTLTLRGHEGAIHDLAYSPDGRFLASAGSDQTVRLWKLDDGSLVWSQHDPGGHVLAVAVSPDGRLVATAGTGKTVTIRDVSSGQPVRSFDGHTNWVMGL